MKRLILISMICFPLIFGCLPKSAIVPQYAGSDAATLLVYRDYKDIGDQFLKVDLEIVAYLLTQDKTEVKIAPGHRVLDAKSMTQMGSMPLVVDFKPGEMRYFRVFETPASGINIQEITQNQFAALMAKNEIKSNFRGKD